MIRAAVLGVTFLAGALFLSPGCKTETYQPDKDDEDDGGDEGSGTGTDDTAGGDDGGTDDTAASDECAELPPAACAESADCAPISARRLIPLGGSGSYCYPAGEEPKVVGCRSKEAACEPVETYAAPADLPNSCMLFANSCIPGGFVECTITGEVAECPPEGGGGTGGGT